jgi:hypothetical protein
MKSLMMILMGIVFVFSCGNGNIQNGQDSGAVNQLEDPESNFDAFSPAFQAEVLTTEVPCRENDCAVKADRIALDKSDNVLLSIATIDITDLSQWDGLEDYYFADAAGDQAGNSIDLLGIWLVHDDD